LWGWECGGVWQPRQQQTLRLRTELDDTPARARARAVDRLARGRNRTATGRPGWWQIEVLGRPSVATFVWWQAGRGRFIQPPLLLLSERPIDAMVCIVKGGFRDLTFWGNSETRPSPILPLKLGSGEDTAWTRAWYNKRAPWSYRQQTTSLLRASFRQLGCLRSSITSSDLRVRTRLGPLYCGSTPRTRGRVLTVARCRHQACKHRVLR
jgi:hypothetical protein